jgi:type IV secretory pathway VirB3-like protein
MVNMRPCSRKVRRSLLQRELLGGVPTSGLILVLIMAVVFLYVLRMFFMVVPIAVLYMVMRYLTAKDPWMIDIVLDNIQQKDVFIP